MLQAFEIRRLASIVELLDERRTELQQQSVYRVPPSDLGILCDGVDDHAEGIEVAQHVLAAVRPLNLDRHLAPIPSGCTVNLRQGGRRKAVEWQSRAAPLQAAAGS